MGFRRVLPIPLFAVALALCLTPTIALARADGGQQADGRCGTETANAILAAGSKRGAHRQPKAMTVLCGEFAGRHRQTMTIALAAGRCNLGRGWRVFRLTGGRWLPIWHYKGELTGIAKRGRRIEETTSVNHPSQEGCRYLGRKWRLWHWTGNEFKAGPWHLPGGSGGAGRGRARLVLSPKKATTEAGVPQHYTVTLVAVDGTHRDVTDEALMSMTPAASEDPTEIYANKGCQTEPWGRECEGSCDARAGTCSSIWPGAWTVHTSYEQPSTHKLYTATAILDIDPRNDLEISPTELPSHVPGVPYEAQLSASGPSEGPLTWQIYGPNGEHSVSDIQLDVKSGALSGGEQIDKYGFEPAVGKEQFVYSLGKHEFLARVRDDHGNSGVRTLTIDFIEPTCASVVCASVVSGGGVLLVWNYDCGCSVLTPGEASGYKFGFEIGRSLNGEAPHIFNFNSLGSLSSSTTVDRFWTVFNGEPSGVPLAYDVRFTQSGGSETTDVGTSNTILK